MWREKLSPRNSRAEFKLARALSAKGIRGWKMSPVLPVAHACPDFYFPSRRLAVYLDGPHHRSERQQLKDEWIGSLLKKRGIRVLRFSYNPPLTQTRLKEILAEIVGAIK